MGTVLLGMSTCPNRAVGDTSGSHDSRSSHECGNKHIFGVKGNEHDSFANNSR